jgi:hypothetical protein
MRPTTSNIFDTNLALLPSSLTARTSTRVGNKDVGSKGCSTSGSFYGTRGMKASSWGVVSTALQRVLEGGKA